MHEITRRAAELKRQVERRRFAGEDPVVALTPRLGQVEVVARTLAAERAGAALTIGEARYNPGEDLAEAAIRGAIGALRAHSFAAARARLDEAAERASDPEGQQRISLFKALTRHLSALIYIPLGEKLRLGLADLDDTLRGLDLLPAAERLHYRDEIDRLLTLREAAAGGDPFLDASWTLVRAQLAMGAGQDEAALLWLLRLAARLLPGSPDSAPADGYLADLATRARHHILTMIGLPPPTPAEATKAPESVRPREFFNALAARLSADFGRDLVQGMGFFALSEYVAAEVASDEAGSPTEQRYPATGKER